MEYAEGETLSEVLQRKGTLTEAELKRILFPILDGLAAVHEADFLHRDIKPSNIVIRDDGSPVLIDFGSARQAVAGKSRSVTAIVTPGYAPIEQYSVKGHQGPWTGYLRVGCGVLPGVLTGEAPDDATERLREDPLVPISKRCEGKANTSLLNAIDRAPAGLGLEGERPQSIAEWREILSNETAAPAYHGRKDTTKPTARLSSAPSEGNREGRLSELLLVGVVLALLYVGAYWKWQNELLPDEHGSDVALSRGVSATGKQAVDPFAAYREGDVRHEEVELPAKVPALSPWSQLALDIQTSLKTLGYNPGTVDGIYGERTKVAIEAFQQDIGIPVDGQISRQLLHNLRQELVARQSEKARTTDTKPTTQKNPRGTAFDVSDEPDDSPRVTAFDGFNEEGNNGYTVSNTNQPFKSIIFHRFTRRIFHIRFTRG